MIRRLPLLLMALGAFGCGGAAARPPPVCPTIAASGGAATGLARPATAAGACAEAADLGWLDGARELRITEISQGHFGLWELHADLVNDEDNTFAGVIVGTYRRRAGAPTHTASAEVRLDAREVLGMLSAFRESAQGPPRDVSGRHVYTSDSSRSEAFVIDVSLPLDRGSAQRRAPRHLQLYVDDAETVPEAWRVRGCESAFSYEASTIVTEVFATFLEKLGRDALFEALRESGQNDRMP